MKAMKSFSLISLLVIALVVIHAPARVKANLDDLAFLNQVAWDWRSRQASPMTVINSERAQGERLSLGPMPSRATSAIAREIRYGLSLDSASRGECWSSPLTG